MRLADKVAIVAGGREVMRAAHEINGPTFAHAIVTTRDIIAGFSAA